MSHFTAYFGFGEFGCEILTGSQKIGDYSEPVPGLAVHPAIDRSAPRDGWQISHIPSGRRIKVESHPDKYFPDEESAERAAIALGMLADWTQGDTELKAQGGAAHWGMILLEHMDRTPDAHDVKNEVSHG